MKRPAAPAPCPPNADGYVIPTYYLVPAGTLRLGDVIIRGSITVVVVGLTPCSETRSMEVRSERLVSRRPRTFTLLAAERVLVQA